MNNIKSVPRGSHVPSLIIARDNKLFHHIHQIFSNNTFLSETKSESTVGFSRMEVAYRPLEKDLLL